MQGNSAHGSHAHAGSGPVVWLAIIAVTCLLLLVFQKVLWLVVPFLLALIIWLLRTLKPELQEKD